VPDSLLKEFCLCIDKKINDQNHIIAANEGNAIALASGYFLAKESLPLVYMQNSGLGNAINPLLSLCDEKVYSIPIILLIGWRGEPGIKDEPQHTKQGLIQLDLLSTLDIPYEVISQNDEKYKDKIQKTIDFAKANSRPSAILIKKDTFSKTERSSEAPKKFPMYREEALKIILRNLDNNDVVVSTTGKTSREIFEIRKNNHQKHEKDFLTVGSMGHCSSIALGIAINAPHRKIICIDGDGSMLMHLGSLASISELKPDNFYHIIINNGVHDSVGGQDTTAKNIKISKLAASLGFNKSFKAKTKKKLKLNIRSFLSEKGPSMLEIKTAPGSRANLGRPSIHPIINKKDFIKFLKG
tara:strand:- start:7716 stop:8780 length:1065 start_codon:yes stop_codon:yes gene_type:complete